jgi:hypothetical protein
MASNKNPQSVTNVFSRQPKGGVAAALNAAVRQDKGRISSARTGTPQPAPQTNPVRPHPLSNGATRSQNRPDPKRHTVHLTLHVDPIVKRELQRLAAQEGLTVSKTGAAFLKQALQHNVDMHYSALLTPIIEAAIDKRMHARDSRFAWLMARTIFASEQTRAIAANILGRQQGMTEETLKTILEMTKRAAQATLTRRNPELEELIAAVRQWLEEAEQENIAPQSTDAMTGVNAT